MDLIQGLVSRIREMDPTAKEKFLAEIVTKLAADQGLGLSHMTPDQVLPIEEMNPGADDERINLKDLPIGGFRGE